MFWAEIWKISEFLSEIFHFLVVKFSVYLNRRVFVMIGSGDTAFMRRLASTAALRICYNGIFSHDSAKKILNFKPKTWLNDMLVHNLTCYNAQKYHIFLTKDNLDVFQTLWKTSENTNFCTCDKTILESNFLIFYAVFVFVTSLWTRMQHNRNKWSVRQIAFCN